MSLPTLLMVAIGIGMTTVFLLHGNMGQPRTCASSTTRSNRPSAGSRQETFTAPAASGRANVGRGGDCLPWITYTGNVGKKCGASACRLALPQMSCAPPACTSPLIAPMGWVYSVGFLRFHLSSPSPCCRGRECRVRAVTTGDGSVVINHPIQAPNQYGGALCGRRRDAATVALTLAHVSGVAAATARAARVSRSCGLASAGGGQRQALLDAAGQGEEGPCVHRLRKVTMHQ